MKLSNRRLLELLNNLIEYVDMSKDSKNKDDKVHFWQETIGLTKEEVEYFGFTCIDSSEEEETRVICCNCENIFHEDELELFHDHGGWFKGCPYCKTDGYLRDLTDDDIKNFDLNYED